MQLVPTELPGLQIILPRIFQDARGSFVKTFQADQFRELGLNFEPREEFFSTSAKGVLRGMHFQLPPAATAKLVYCIAGNVLDVVLDLRKNSPTFGRSYAHELNAANREMFFIPIGFAHGFLALADNATMVYQTSTVHSPAHDTGVHWDSFGFDWPVKNPILSERDKKFSTLLDFQSPF
ncbi:MAG TPA: dTDP-4-dehydrorhamnose 3,5-epimerase [Verrucomicrobiae bacterium]